MGTNWLSADCRQAGRDSFCYTIQFRNFTAYVLTVWIHLFFLNSLIPKVFSEEHCPWKMLREQSPGLGSKNWGDIRQLHMVLL